jgi:hypothetical protein
MLTKILAWVSFNSGSRFMIMMEGIRGEIGTLQMHEAWCFMAVHPLSGYSISNK